MQRPLVSLFTLLTITPAAALEFKTESFTHLSPKFEVPITVKVKTPKELHQAPQSLLFLFGGFEEANKVLDLVSPETPVALASFDYPFDAPRKFTFPESLTLLPKARKTLHSSISLVSEVLNSILARYPQIDPKQVSIIGASLGAPLAVYAAERDPRFSGVILIHGFADLPGTIRHQLWRKWGPPRHGKWIWPFVSVLSYGIWWSMGLRSVESAAEGLHPNQKVLLIEAEEDEFLPEKSRSSLKASLENSKSQLSYIKVMGGHLMPGAKDKIRALLKIVTDWCSQQALIRN